MLKGENIICISSIDWDFIWQGHQEIMSVLAKNGNRVLFIENTGVRMPGFRDIRRIRDRIKKWFSGVSGIRKEMDNLYVFSPLILPFPYLRIAGWINRHIVLSILKKWIKIMNFDNPVIWVFLPTPLSLNIIDNLDSKAVIYYCIDNFRASSTAATKIRRSEIKLLKMAELVFVTSRELYDYCSSYRDNENVSIFPFAVNFEEFRKASLKKDFVPAEIKPIKKPIIGYVGGVHKWVDLKLIKETVQRYPQYSFVFAGPIQTDVSSLSGLKNIYFLGKKEHKEIPYIINTFDVCIIPYLVTEYTKNVYPTKLNEYHALGKPVVSTDLPEITNFNKENDNLVLIGKTSEEFIIRISEAVNGLSPVLVDKRISSAQKNSWASRIEEMSKLIESAIEKKAGIPLNWKENFLKLYRGTRRKILTTALVFFSAYFLLFYTPLIWFMAKPLKIDSPLGKADAIVVFAGGVGESGQAGQGYEERIQHAVELYKNGYAKYLILSSGLRTTFPEPYVMEILAVNLGVPQEAIILESKAANTYENVKFTEEILCEKNWNKVILVSSPYHMKRASLVFKKLKPPKQVIFSPVVHSVFYNHPSLDIRGRKIWKQINLNQIKGIVHEYLGIIYYWWKGYI